MGLTYVKVRVGNPANGRRAEDVNCLVDSGAVYSLIPGRVLRKLGIKPHSAREFVLANGETVRRRLATATFEYDAPPHFLLFMRQQTLLAQPFDASSLTLTGEPASVAEGLRYNPDSGRAAFAVSDTGTLAYRTGTEREQRSLMWIDRSGKTSGAIGDPLSGILIRLSPDGKRVVFSEATSDAAEDVWIYDLERNQKALLTSDPGINHLPVWSPDGSRVGFDSSRDGNDDHHVLYERRADGATAERILVQPEPGMGYGLLDWTSDYLVFSKGKLGQQVNEIWAQPLSGDRKPFRYFSGVGPTNATLSPNGRWLAYVVNEGGTNQVVVQSFPDPSQSRRQISSRGGAYPHWRRDGRELFYLDPDRKMIAVSVVTDGPVEVQKSIELFAAPIQFPQPGALFSGSPYDVTANGQRFLFSAEGGGMAPTAPITVVLNWTAALKK